VFKKAEFFGNTTVGERGQVVLPINLRKSFEIQAGDKLIVAGIPGPGLVIMFKAEFFDEMLKRMDAMRELLQGVKEMGAKNGDTETTESEDAVSTKPRVNV
jgi:AbrB family looped-hinge helix DNA binding protein